jgi:transcriptional regulator with XRE-family HTH domain
MVDHRRLSPEELITDLRHRVEVGVYMTNIRTEHGISLANLGKVLNVSANFISELERGIKTPGDKYIRNFSKYFDIDESSLFKKCGRIPLLAREELEENTMLQQMLEEIRKNPQLTDERKKTFYEDVYALCKNLLDKYQ